MLISCFNLHIAKLLLVDFCLAIKDFSYILFFLPLQGCSVDCLHSTCDTGQLFFLFIFPAVLVLYLRVRLLTVLQHNLFYCSIYSLIKDLFCCYFYMYMFYVNIKPCELNACPQLVSYLNCATCGSLYLFKRSFFFSGILSLGF